MANQVIVTNTGNVQVALTPPPNVQVQISRAAIGTISNVPTANFANYAANVTASNQPNITSLGTLTALNVLGNGTITNFVVTGNLQAGNLFANNANYANFAGEAFNVNVSNVSGLGNIATVNLDGNISNVLRGDGSFGSEAGNLNANYANFAGEAFIVNASNILGTINLANFATVANGVAVGNVSGIGNIATVNLDGNASNVLFGNGVFGPESGNLNANYANFAGEAFNVNASNITGTVANANYSAYAGQANTANLATFATTANAVAGANVSGEVANANFANYSNIASSANSVALANVVGIGNIANINLDGNASNILFGNGTFSAIPVVSNVANANYANFAGTAYSVSGANVSGAVANATYANTANVAVNVQLTGQAGTGFIIGSVAGGGNTTIGQVSSSIKYSGSTLIAGALQSDNTTGTAPLFVKSTTLVPNLYVARANVADSANSVAGANVSGTVANANFAGYANIASSANSVALANVVGIGNIANINLDGNASNILFGNGTFSAIPVVSNVANANYANFAGTAFSVSGSNVSGEVANANFASYANLASTANLATFATTANAVAGANVSGEVANANYASYANIANTANSVALANVVGIGNIANINLDGSSSNVLFGNGVFAPESTSIANANYANFAGNALTLANGTSNVNIPVANGTIAFSVNNTANLMLLENGGVVNAFPTSSVVNMLRINTFNNSLSDAHRIAWARARGSNTSPTSVQAFDRLGVLGFFGHNGTSYQTNSISFIRSTVDGSYTTNDTNIPIGLQLIVNDTNGGVNNQAKTHQFWANGNVTFANSVFVTDSLSVTGNVTGNYIIGNGSSLSSLTGGNVTGQVANALVAGTVYTNAQPNITSTGNLISLNVVNSANVTGTIQQLAPNTITITTNATNNTAYDLTTIYGDTSNIAESGQRAIIRSRGNVSTPATVAVSDVGSRDRVYFYNGTTNAIGFTSSVILSNLNSNSNAYSTGTNYNISTGNPNGDQGNANASSAFNTLSFRDTGQLILLPGANSTAGSMLNMINYGQPASLSTAQGITMSKARGNRDANLSVQANDQIGRVVFQAHNGTSFVTNRLPIIRATVDANYTPNTANVPAGFQFLVNDNTTTYTHNFYANGTTLFGGNLVSLGVTGTSTLANVDAGNVSIGNGANVARLTIYGDKSIYSGISLNNGQYRVISDNVDPSTGFSPLSFGSFENANTNIPANRFFRGRGTEANTQPVVTNDQIMTTSYAVYADSGNTYLDTFNDYVYVTGNDGAGNVTAAYQIRAFNTGSIIELKASNVSSNGNITTSGFVSAANVVVQTSGFMKLASYTAAGLTAVTGQIGWMAAVSNSGGGGNPNGMIAFWDTTNSRWSYIHDNSAV